MSEQLKMANDSNEDSNQLKAAASPSVPPDNDLTQIKNLVFEKLSSNDTNAFQQLIMQLKDGVNFVDDTGMTPLQHACCKANKEAVEMLLNMGADINYSRHGANYTPLHFAALSGSSEICRRLLDAGVNPKAVNSVSRTASQMAAFVGNHACVETIINYIPKSELKCYVLEPGTENVGIASPSNTSKTNSANSASSTSNTTANSTANDGAVSNGVTTNKSSNSSNQMNRNLIPGSAINLLHRFVTDINLHPVRIVLNLQNYPLLMYLSELREILTTMSNKEMHKSDCNELLAFKFHYLSWIMGDLLRCKSHAKKVHHHKKKANRIDESTEQVLAAIVPPMQSTPLVNNMERKVEAAVEEAKARPNDHDQSKPDAVAQNGTDNVRATRSVGCASTVLDGDGNRHDYVEMYIKRLLKENKCGQMDYLDYMIRECVREFPYRESIIFKQVISQLANSSQSAYTILRIAINGHRGFSNVVYCNACGNEKPDKKCSKCKAVQYCNRECQRLHWFMHKKSCNRPVSSTVGCNTSASVNATKVANAGTNTDAQHSAIDMGDVCAGLEQLNTAAIEKA